MSRLRVARVRLKKLVSRKARLRQSAEAAGLTPSDVAAILDSEPARFSSELAEAWQICDSLLNQIHQALSEGAEARIFDTSVKFRSTEHAQAFVNLDGTAGFEWLKQNGYGTEVVLIVFKQVCRALASDLVEFATQALNCTIRGPLTVAIALLRKPLKEDLFFLEWLLADTDDFLQRFFGGDIERFKLERLSSQRKIEIIRGAMTASTLGEWIPAEYIYRFRFDKMTDIGFERLWQKANHLVTTLDPLRTERENFNFVFSNDEDRKAQWAAFYGLAPILFFHVVQVFEALLARFSTRKDSAKDFSPIRTLAGMLLWMRSKGCILDLTPAKRYFARIVTGFIRQHRCPKCGAVISWREENMRRLFENASVRCLSCNVITCLDER